MKIKDFWHVIMLSEDSKISESSKYKKSDKTPFIFYADFQCLIQKVDVKNMDVKIILKTHTQQK